MFSSSTIINCWYSFHLERPITKASRRLNSVGFSCSKYLHNYIVYLTNLCYFACFCLKIFKQTRFKKGNVLFSRLVIKYSGDCFEAVQNTHSTRSNNLKPLKSAVRVLNITYSKDLIYKYCQKKWIFFPVFYVFTEITEKGTWRPVLTQNSKKKMTEAALNSSFLK